MTDVNTLFATYPDITHAISFCELMLSADHRGDGWDAFRKLREVAR